MFSKKSSNKVTDNASTVKVNQDLIVHSMPRRSRFSSYSMAPATAAGRKTPEAGPVEAPHDSKIVGGLIIGLGLILVGVLVYLVYQFFIRPQAETPPPTSPQQAVTRPETTNTNPVVEPIQTATSTVVETGNVDEIDWSEGEEETNENEPEMVMPEEGVSGPGQTWTPVLDSDGDGLTDEEEAALGTSPENIDTDGDGYLDLAEIKSGYDPLGTGLLKDSSAVKSYQGVIGNYSILYPASWNLRALNNGYTTVISAPDNSLMQVSVQDNLKKQNISGWYQEAFAGAEVSYDRLKNGERWEGIISEDGLNFYLTDQNYQNIYVISYIPALSGRLAYPNIFQIIINSFTLN